MTCCHDVRRKGTEMRKLWFILVFMQVCGIGWCQAQSPEDGPDKIVAECDGEVIRKIDLDVARPTLPAGATDEFIIEQLARNLLGQKKALQAGIDQEPDIKWRLWAIGMNAASRDLFERQIIAGINPSDEEVKKAYQERITNYVVPGSFSFRYIFGDTTECTSKEQVAEVRKKIDQAHQELLKPLGQNAAQPWIVAVTHFNEVAGKYSDVRGDPTRIAGPFTLKEPLQPVIKKMALSLVPGEMSEVFSTRYGYEIIRLETRIEDATTEFDTVKDTLRQEVLRSQQNQKAKDYIQKLKDDTSRYEIYEDRFAQILPGAHFEVPSTTAAIRVGRKLYPPGDIEDYLKNLYRKEWVRAREKKEAMNLAWQAFILPQLLHEEAEKAGYTREATEQARIRIEKASFLTNSLLRKETERLAGELPKPTTDEIEDLYVLQSDKHRVAAQYQMTVITHPIDELKNRSSNPARNEFLYREGEKRLSDILASLIAGASPDQAVKATQSEKTPLNKDVRWISKGLEFQEETWSKLVSWPVGQWYSQPIRTEKGVVIVQVLDMAPERTKPLSEVRSQLERELKNSTTREIFSRQASQMLDEVRASLKMK